MKTASLDEDATVTFVGAGPGAADLLTLRAVRAIERADVVIWAASLVSPEVLEHARAAAETHDSSKLTLEDVVAMYEEAAAAGRRVVRLQSGDPFLYGAIGEQIVALEERGIRWTIVPGVSAVGAAAAQVGAELTVPEVTQSVVLTRIVGRTPMPDGEGIADWARHGSTMAVFLAAARPVDLQAELLEGYPPDTPAIVVHRSTWPDEDVRRCTVGTLRDTLVDSGWRLQVLVLVGPGLGTGAREGRRSNLYDPAFAHRYRSRQR